MAVRRRGLSGTFHNRPPFGTKQVHNHQALVQEIRRYMEEGCREGQARTGSKTATHKSCGTGAEVTRHDEKNPGQVRGHRSDVKEECTRKGFNQNVDEAFEGAGRREVVHDAGEANVTKADIKDRHTFSMKYADKPAGWWTRHIHLVIDVKFFPVYLHTKARRHAVQIGPRGVYRKEGQPLTEDYYKPNLHLKYNTGAKGVHVLAGVGDGRVLLWEYIEERQPDCTQGP